MFQSAICALCVINVGVPASASDNICVVWTPSASYANIPPVLNNVLLPEL